MQGLEVVLRAYNSKQRFIVFKRDHVEFVDNIIKPSFTERIEDCAVIRDIAKTISPRPLFSGRGLVRTESGCVQTSLEFSSW